MTANFHDAISSLHLQDPSPVGSSNGHSDLGRSYESTSSVDSNYTRRGQTESEADIKAGLAAARVLATSKRKLVTDQLSSSPRPRRHSTENEEESNVSGAMTALPDTSKLFELVTVPLRNA